MWKKWSDDPRAQYDHHAQLIFRVRDQDCRTVPHFDIFFESRQGDIKARPIQTLFKDKHLNGVTPNIITFYRRTDAFNKSRGKRIPQIPEIRGCALEVTTLEPKTDAILYLPLRLELSSEQIQEWV